MKLNNKGFSMVEILAVVALLGILVSIAVFGVSRYKTKAINDDYEALAKSSYNAMQEYVMTNPYETEATIGKLEEQRFLSNRKDPASKESDCEGAVVYEQKAGTAGSMDEGKYTVYLCCPSYKKKYTFPGGKVENITDDTYCEVSGEPDTPEPPTPPGPTTVTCSAGKYLPKNTTSCETCKAGNYCKGGTWTTSTTKDQGLTPCPSGYKNSPTGSKKVEQCYMKVTAGTYVKNKKDPVSSSCGKGTYKVAHNVNYNSTSKCSSCPTGYKDGVGATKESNCIMSVPRNKYVKKAKDSSATACPSGQQRDAHKVNYGKVSSCAAQSIEVTFDCNGGTINSGPAKSTYYSNITGQKFSTTCKRDGYEQDGWKRSKTGSTKNYETASGVSENFVLTYSPSLTIYAHWKAIPKYKITVKAGTGIKSVKLDGSTTTLTKNVYAGTKVTIDATMEDFYSFSKWSDGNTTKSRSITVTKDITLTATGIKNTVKLNYNTNSGQLSPGIEQRCKAGCPNKESDCTWLKNRNWKSADGCISDTTRTGTVRTVEVDYDSNTWSSLGLADYSAKNGASIYMTRSGCTATKYWHVDGTGSTNKIHESEDTFSTARDLAKKANKEAALKTGNVTITVYAGWTCIVKYKCSAGNYLPKNKTTCSKCESGYYCPGGEWEKSTTKDQGKNTCPTGYGNSAAGSDAASDCYMKVPEKNYVKTAKDKNYTVCPSGKYKSAHNVNYGKISSCESKSIVVTFDCNGGTRSSGNATATYSTDVTGQKFSTTCARTGYDQDGWKRNKNGSKRDYTTNSGVSENWILSYTPKITIYAHWNIKSITCAAGKYLPKSAVSCSNCTSGNYCLGGTFTYSTTTNQGINKCSTEATGYPYSKEGSKRKQDCYMNVSKDYYVQKKKDKTATKCGTGYGNPAHTVNYESTSSCGKKPTCSITSSPKANKIGWNNKNVTITMTVTGSPTQKGLATSKGSTNNKTSASITTEGKYTYYGYVKNAYGEGSCSINIKLDKTAPVWKTLCYKWGTINGETHGWLHVGYKDATSHIAQIISHRTDNAGNGSRTNMHSICQYYTTELSLYESTAEKWKDCKWYTANNSHKDIAKGSGNAGGAGSEYMYIHWQLCDAAGNCNKKYWDTEQAIKLGTCKVGSWNP